MKGRTWRLILGWFLVVFGVLVVLFGAIAIAGSYDPSIQDPGSARIGGAVVIAIGFMFTAPGVFLLMKARRLRRAMPEQPRQTRPAPRLTLAHVVGSAAGAIAVVALGVAALVYSHTLDDAAQSFRSAHQCAATGDSNCYQLRDVVITGVDVSHGNQGESDTVHFTDAGSLQEVVIDPGDRDSSVLRTGADAVATMWRGKYTNLKVAGVSFATTDNPVGQRGEWRLLGYIGIGLGLLYATVAVALVRQLRKRSAAEASSQGTPLGTFELLPQSAVIASGYPILPLVLHPKPLGRLAWFLLLPLAAGLGLVFGFLGQFGAVVQWLAGSALAAAFVWMLVYRRNSGIFVDEMTFGTMGGLGRKRSWARNDAARVVVMNVDRGRRTGPLALALVVGPDGRARMRFAAEFYDAESLRQFLAALRVPLETGADGDLVRTAELEKQIPGSTRWSMRHAGAVGGGMAIVAIVVFGAVMLMIGVGPSHR